jgi:hypothetical protein
MYVNTGKGGTKPRLSADRLKKSVLTRDKIEKEGDIGLKMEATRSSETLVTSQ